MKVEFPKVNNKLAFFDFDRTLVAHSYSKGYLEERQNGYMTECFQALTVLMEEHAKDKPLPCMQWYVRKLYEEGYGLYCLTHEIFNLRDEMKKDQLKVFYGDTPMTYLTVDTADHKIDMMKAVAAVEECDLSDVIFVDDLMRTVNLAAEAGIDAKHLSDIVALYETQTEPYEQDMVKKPIALSWPEGEEIEYAKAEDGWTENFLEESEAALYEECRRLAELNGREQESGL